MSETRTSASLSGVEGDNIRGTCSTCESRPERSQYHVFKYRADNSRSIQLAERYAQEWSMGAKVLPSLRPAEVQSEFVKAFLQHATVNTPDALREP